MIVHVALESRPILAEVNAVLGDLLHVVEDCQLLAASQSLLSLPVSDH